MTDELSERYGELLQGAYDCVDRIVLKAYFSLGHNPGGFRVWWRRLHDNSEEHLDNTHLMRMAGRFSRRVRAWATANQIPVIDCGRGERKHRIAEQYLATHSVGPGVFLILVARAAASVWEVKRSAKGVIGNLAKKTAYVNHYSFHIMDPEWGHLTVKMSGHPPFGAQVILNGHEWVACQAQTAGIGYTKQGNCFTAVADPQALAQVADTLSQQATVGRLRQVCDRWIYSACLCFGLTLAEQQRSGFRYDYSVYQAEYSRNLLFRSGAQMDAVFGRLVDRTRGRLDVPKIRTLFGAKARPHRDRTSTSRIEAVVETPHYDLTLFKVHFGNLTLKAYTKGEHVLRFEAIVHNTRNLGCGRVLARFPEIITRLNGMLERFLTTLDCIDAAFVPDQTLDQLPLPSQIGSTRVGGVDLNQPASAPRSRPCSLWPPHPTASPSPSWPPRSSSRPDRPTVPTPPARPPTTSRSCAARTWSSNPAGHGATTPHPRRCAPSPRCWCCARRSSSRSLLGSVSPGGAASPRPGPAPTSTTKPSVSG
jgi:hypothetical protein